MQKIILTHFVCFLLIASIQSDHGGELGFEDQAADAIGAQGWLPCGRQYHTDILPGFGANMAMPARVTTYVGSDHPEMPLWEHRTAIEQAIEQRRMLSL